MSASSAAETPFLGSDRFAIQRRLGMGGMGVVYQAFDRERDQVVALKTLRDLDAATVVRFKREFRALADVSHPNLVSLYELISVEGHIFFTMEMVPGVSFLRWARGHDSPATETDPADDDTMDLSQLPGASGPPTESTSPGKRAHATPGPRAAPTNKQPSRPIMSSEPGPATLDLARLRPALQQLAEGVAALHASGMLHRDLKPSNVLVTREGRVKILDFGLVTELARDSGVEDALVGTAAYMSPEQGARLALTPASDWYAVGVMLYEALTGRLPFVGASTEVLMDKQQFEPPSPRELAPGAPQDLAALCVELLRRDPAQRPSAREVLRRLGSGTAAIRTATRRSSARGALLVGRQGHAAALEAALNEVRRGRAVVEFVHGGSGMGKSALVRRFLDGLEEESSAVVLTGRCYERESVPYKAVDSLVDGLSHYLSKLPRLDCEGLMPRDVRALARVFPVLRQVEAVTAAPKRADEPTDRQELRRRAFAALRELLARLADRQTLVLAIDDVQWGDVDSAVLLAALLRPPDAPALLLVATHRSVDSADSTFLRAFKTELMRQGSDVRELPVEPLPPADARALALQLLQANGAQAEAQAERIAAEAGGSPFFIDELARHVREGDSARPEMISLEEVLQARLRRLPDEARRLLGAVAVAGRPLQLSVVLRAAEVKDPAALALLKAGSLVRARGAVDAPLIECWHDRIRESALALLDANQLRWHHLRLALALASTPQPDAEALANHFLGAGEVERAAEFAAEAAVRAEETLAFERAAQLYRFALELRPFVQAGAAGPAAAADERALTRNLQVRLGDALANAGRGAEAADAYLQAAVGAGAAERLELYRVGAEELLRSGHIKEGEKALQEVLSHVDMRLARSPSTAVARLLWRRARLRLRGLKWKERDASQVPPDQLRRVDVAYALTSGLSLVDHVRAADFQAQQLLLALATGEPHRVARALAAEASFLATHGVSYAKRSHEALTLLNELAERLNTPEAQAYAEGAFGVVAFQEGRWAECIVHCEEAEQIFRNRCTGHAWERSTAIIFALFASALMGRVRHLCSRLPGLQKEALERGDLHSFTNLQAAIGYYPGLCADDPQSARQALHDAMARWNVTDAVQLQHFNALMSENIIDLYCGKPEDAWRRIGEGWPRFDKALMLRAETILVSALMARSTAALAVSAQQRDASARRQLVEHAARDIAHLGRIGAPYTNALARQMEACLAMHRGDPALAESELAAAEQALLAVGMQMHAASLRWRRGQLVGGDEGRALMAHAEGWMRAEGFRDAERLARTLAPIPAS